MANWRSSSRVEGVAVSVEVVVKFFEISEEMIVVVLPLTSILSRYHVLPQIAVLALPRAVDQHRVQFVAELHLVVT